MNDAADVATAKQLVYAFQEAPTAADEAYAIDEITGFLDTLDERTRTDVLLVLLGLPATEETQPILDDVGDRLAERSPAAVTGLMRAAVLGDDPARANALDVLDQVDTADLAEGLVDLLAGDSEDELKEVAARSMLALGPEAEDQVRRALQDPAARHWIMLARSYGPEGTDADALAAQRAARDEAYETNDDIEIVDPPEAVVSGSNGRGAPAPDDDGDDDTETAPDDDGEAADNAPDDAADDSAHDTDGADTAPDDTTDAGLDTAQDDDTTDAGLDTAPDDAGPDDAGIGPYDGESAAVDETSDFALDDPSVADDAEDPGAQLERDFEAYKQHLDDASNQAGGGEA